VPFAWPEHWARLKLSAAAILLRLDLDEATIARRIAATLAAAGPGDHYVRLIVTRGSRRGTQHRPRLRDGQTMLDRHGAAADADVRQALAAGDRRPTAQ
jgi:branched-subunit amino acid aminotransferase/4-amino-4-deoxychorismate lyase